jgi:hypothetical protein
VRLELGTPAKLTFVAVILGWELSKHRRHVAPNQGMADEIGRDCVFLGGERLGVDAFEGCLVDWFRRAAHETAGGQKEQGKSRKSADES